ncbi:MAG: peptide MFS transporter [Candidatus Eisenbacteria bacterium]|nr:peptide MFS transporter [Candidatus Eisenbacteria bacterium]
MLPRSTRTFLGHPVGLFVLFFTEMWERFSYYGMRGLLKLYMVNYLFVTLRQSLQGKQYDTAGDPGSILGWGVIKHLLPSADPGSLAASVAERAKALMATVTASGAPMYTAEVAHRIASETSAVQQGASVIYGWYTGLVYLTPLLGGYLADKFLGQKKAVFIGGGLMAIGQYMLWGSESLFFVALLLLILGNGFFKPNISTQVGSLYPQGDPRRDGAFTIFYMGINLGAFICNLICGTLAALYGWRWGFFAAGVGMCLGLVVQALGQRFLAPDTLQARQHAAVAAKQEKPAPHAPLTPVEWRSIWALVILCGLNIVFWAVYEQQGNTMQTWADEKTIWPVILGFQIPSTWFQSVNPFFIFLFAPFLDIFWRWQNKKGQEPTSVAKMAVGSMILGLSFIVMIIGVWMVGSGQGSWFWPVFCTMLLTVGELYLSPVGLSLVTKVSPRRIVSMMMGMWFLSSFFGNILSGYIGQLYTIIPKEMFFLILLLLGCGTGIAIWLFNKPLKEAMASHST